MGYLYLWPKIAFVCNWWPEKRNEWWCVRYEIDFRLCDVRKWLQIIVEESETHLIMRRQPNTIQMLFILKNTGSKYYLDHLDGQNLVFIKKKIMHPQWLWRMVSRKKIMPKLKKTNCCFSRAPSLKHTVCYFPYGGYFVSVSNFSRKNLVRSKPLWFSGKIFAVDIML